MTLEEYQNCLVTIGGECFRFEFQSSQPGRQTARVHYLYLIEDLKSQRGTRPVSVVFSNACTISENAPLNAIRRALDSGNFSFDSPADASKFTEVSYTSAADGPAPIANDTEIRELILNEAYWRSWKLGHRGLVAFDGPVNLDYLGVTASVVRKHQWFLERKGLLVQSNVPGSGRPTTELIELFEKKVAAREEEGRYPIAKSEDPATKGSLMASKRKKVIAALIGEAKSFRFCGPSDDPDEQTAVTGEYRHLVVRFKRIVGPFLSEPSASHLNAIEVEINDIYSAYRARDELDALLPDIEDAAEFLDEAAIAATTNRWIVSLETLSHLDWADALEPKPFDISTLVRMCREINSSFAHGNIVATAVLMRTVLNHVPPVFGHSTFAQVAANSGRSLKGSFEHLEEGLRQIADLHVHRKIETREFYPTAAQVEPFKPQFELLIQETLKKVTEGYRRA